MRHHLFMLSILVQLFFALVAGAQTPDLSGLKGPYLGQTPPGSVPELFAPGIISTAEMENNIAFSSDGREVLIERTSDGESKIYRYLCRESGWQTTGQMIFPDNGGGNQPQIQGKTGSLLTTKVIRSTDGPPKIEVYLRKRDGENWGSATRIAFGLRPSIANSGTIYATDIDFAKGFFGRIVRLTLQGDRYSAPQVLSVEVNDPRYSSDHPMIAPDESFLLFSSKRENDQTGQLYVSFRDAQGSWQPAQNLSNALKTPKKGNEWLPTLSHDGKYLFYNVSGDVWWVDANVVLALKPKD